MRPETTGSSHDSSRKCSAHGIFLAPSIYEAWFVTAAHTEEDIAETEAAIAEAMAAL